MADEQSKVSEFVSVTGVDEARAKFYLQSANYELHTALETFYDNDVAEDLNTVNPESAFTSAAASSADDDEDLPYSSLKKTTSNHGGRYATLNQYQNEKDSSDEEGQAFYAGGSEHSGQQIIGPNKKKNPTQHLFDAAKKHGAEVVKEESFRPESTKNKFLFKGAGFKLGSDVQPSQQVVESLKPEDHSTGEPHNVKIKFWKNGFSIDNGPLRDFHDPANSDFLSAVRRGEVPLELRSQVQHGEVHVDMEDRRAEEYVKPKESLMAFTGEGHKLGSPVPQVVVQNFVPLAASVAPKQPTFKVNESKPVTTIQIRLSDGTRLVSKFNHDCTVGDIRALVQNARPGNQNFNLLTTFPNKVLTDDCATIENSKLLNAVIVQRLV